MADAPVGNERVYQALDRLAAAVEDSNRLRRLGVDADALVLRELENHTVLLTEIRDDQREQSGVSS